MLNADGNVLILRRSETHPTLALRRDLPGGEVETGEEPGAALAREIQEETGPRVVSSELMPLYAGANVYDGCNRVRILYVTHLATKRPEVTVSWEHAEVSWIPPEEFANIENDYHDFYHEALVYIRKHQLLADR